jgi:Protein of unknown function (DUF559)
MPSGVYPRTPNQLRAAKANLAKGHAPEARTKANAKIQKMGQDPAFRLRVSEANLKRMRDPEVRARHLAALAGLPVNFKGGNGQEPTPLIKAMFEDLAATGYQRELIIRTKGHGTAHRPPTHYKADFGNPETKHVIEMDGPKHRPMAQRVIDRRKTEVLQALGWTVDRISHK